MRPLEHQLRHSPWAQTISPADLDVLVRHAFERHLPAGGQAMRAGEPAELWMGVTEGLLKLSMVLADGRQCTFSCASAGSWLGEGALLPPSRWRHDAVALRPTRLVCVPRHCFEQLLATNLAFNQHVLAKLNARVGLFTRLLAEHRMLGPEARVARSLASLFDPVLYPGAQRFVALSQQEIGLLAAVSRQRTNAALQALQRAGLLRIEFGGVLVTDLPGLRQYADPLLAEHQGPSVASAVSAAPA
jgi:CRP/FNR family transcriptional regulator, cyclic AMP receptor protein